MTSKVNGTVEILTPCRSETPKNIKTQIGQNNYVMGGPLQPCQFLYKSVQGGLLPIYLKYNRIVTLCDTFPFLPFLFSCRRLQKQESLAVARKPRNAAAVVFGLTFADNIHYKFKSSQASKANLQSSNNRDGFSF